MNKRTHKDLDVWKKAIELVVTVYKLLKSFPEEELYGLTAQIKRSAVSIPSNIAEGASRNSKAEFNRFLNIALSSTSELETQLIISNKLNFLQNNTIFNDIETIRKLISGLIKYLNKDKQ